MKRIRVSEFGGPEVLRLEAVEDLAPGEEEVLIRVRAAGVNPYETYERAGNYGANGRQPPYTPGSDLAGVVEAVGSRVSGLARGDRVYTTGTLTGSYAELALCSPSQVRRLADRCSFAQGAALYVPYVTAYRSLFQLAHAIGGETVLVHGASGGVGIAGVQLARAAGMTVIGTAGTEQGLELIKAEGAHLAFRHNGPGYEEEILAATGGRGVDVILEVAAHRNLARDLRLLAVRGRVVVIGSRGDIEITPRQTMLKDTSIIGMLLWNTPPGELETAVAALNAGLENGTLRPVVGAEIPLPYAPDAHRRLGQGGALGKIILVP